MSMSSVPWRSPARCCACFAMEDILPDTSMAAFGTGMGDGAGRWSLVKYNQPQSSREVWRLTREHRCR